MHRLPIGFSARDFTGVLSTAGVAIDEDADGSPMMEGGTGAEVETASGAIVTPTFSRPGLSAAIFLDAHRSRAEASRLSSRVS